MGFELERFEGEVDEELICPICKGVLEDPLQAPICEHAFCRTCIMEWLSHKSTCPVDRRAVNASQYTSVPAILRNLLSRLYVKCENTPHGCNAVLKLDSVATHLLECGYNPKKPVLCEKGCGLLTPMDELADHNCIYELRWLIEAHRQKLNTFEQELVEHRQAIHQQKQELTVLKVRVKLMSVIFFLQLITLIIFVVFKMYG